MDYPLQHNLQSRLDRYSVFFVLTQSSFEIRKCISLAVYPHTPIPILTMSSTEALRADKLFSVMGQVCVVTGGGTGIGLMYLLSPIDEIIVATADCQ